MIVFRIKIVELAGFSMLIKELGVRGAVLGLLMFALGAVDYTLTAEGE